MTLSCVAPLAPCPVLGFFLFDHGRSTTGLYSLSLASDHVLTEARMLRLALCELRACTEHGRFNHGCRFRSGVTYTALGVGARGLISFLDAPVFVFIRKVWLRNAKQTNIKKVPNEGSSSLGHH